MLIMAASLTAWTTGILNNWQGVCQYTTYVFCRKYLSFPESYPPMFENC